MARDRQRAKQRRRRQSGGAPAGRPARGTSGDPSLPEAHADAGLEDVLDERGPEGTTPAPDPLKHSSPYVDEAKLAEGGVDVPPRAGDEDDGAQEDVVEPYDGGEDGVVYDDEVSPGADDEDEDEGDYADEPRALAPEEPEGEAGARVAGGDREGRQAGARERRPERRGRSGVIAFLGHSADELRRVQWPNRRQTGQGTAVTLGFVVLAGGYLGLMDAIWKPIVEAII